MITSKQYKYTTNMTLRKATRQKAKIRLGLSAVSGGGKTFSALLIASGMTDWDKIAVIDTENQSADLYSHLGSYNVLPITAPYTPEKYIEAIHTCEKAGMDVIIIDSISHEWDGKGGCLSIQEQLGGKYQDWAKVTPRHQAFIDAILQSPCHIITTVRRKQDYEMTKDSNGRVKVEKAGLKEITREGFEYELLANLELDIKHNATASKDRTGLFVDKPAFIPSAETGRTLLQWCNSGAEPIADPVDGVVKVISECDDLPTLQRIYTELPEDVKKDARVQAAKDARKAVLSNGTTKEGAVHA
jgi:hypothetical protein